MKKNKCSSSCCTYNQTLSEEQEERMEIDMDNNRDFKESSEPVEIIREEVTEVAESAKWWKVIEKHSLCHQ
jgi:hypothetical protein